MSARKKQLLRLTTTLLHAKGIAVYLCEPLLSLKRVNQDMPRREDIGGMNLLNIFIEQ